ncbi:MAG: DUF3047 domain-containing protein [Caldimonas sp.]
MRRPNAPVERRADEPGRVAMSHPHALVDGAPGLRLERRQVILAAAALAGLAGCRTVRVPVAERACNFLAPFSGEHNLGGVPACWRPQIMRRDLPATLYEVAERDGVRVLHSVSDGGTSGLRCDVDIDPNDTPWLHWTWRVDSLDLRATVASDELDDSPTRLIVAFDGDNSLLTPRDRLFHEMVETVTGYTSPFATLMYVWDGRAPTESIFQYPRTTRIRYLVVESGAANTGRWLRYSRNLVDDYRRVFGGEPGRIRAVAVLTDSDDLKSHSEAWYGDIALSGAEG